MRFTKDILWEILYWWQYRKAILSCGVNLICFPCGKSQLFAYGMMEALSTSIRACRSQKNEILMVYDCWMDGIIAWCRLFSSYKHLWCPMTSEILVMNNWTEKAYDVTLPISLQVIWTSVTAEMMGNRWERKKPFIFPF